MKKNYQNNLEGENSMAENILTIEKLRQYKGLENISDQQALNIIQSVTALCQIAGRAALELYNNAARL